MHENPELCSACGGQCCKHYPGSAYPDDLGLPDDASRLATALQSGSWAIDWWEGDPRPDHYKLDRGYFVRPAVQGYEGRRYHGTWGGSCVFLADSGCTLAAEERPRQCRELEPKPGMRCDNHGFGKREAALAWLPYHELLLNIPE